MLDRVGARVLLVVGFLALAGIVKGTQGVALWAGNRTITTMTVAEYEKNGTEASWVELKDGRLFYPGWLIVTTTRERSDGVNVPTATDYYIPVVPADATGEAPFRILVHDRSGDARATVRQIQAAARKEGAIERDREKFFPRAIVRGILDRGPSDTRKALDEVKDNGLAPGWMILEKGEEPDLGESLAMLLPGLAVPGAIAYILLWKPKARPLERRPLRTGKSGRVAAAQDEEEPGEEKPDEEKPGETKKSPERGKSDRFGALRKKRLGRPVKDEAEDPGETDAS